LQPTPPGTTVFNFTASHDGIGVRPLEGIMPAERQRRFIEQIRARGGLVSMKRNRYGTESSFPEAGSTPCPTESPYELNITYFSALGDPDQPDPDLHIRRFLTSQAIMLSLRGIPGIYFHSLVATPNDAAGVEQTGRARSINRRKFTLDELQAAVSADGSAPYRVLHEYRRMLGVRVRQPAFHPEAPQRVIDLGRPPLVGLVRASLDGRQQILVLANVGPEPQEVDCGAAGLRPTADLLAAPAAPPVSRLVRLAPWQTAWLAVEPHTRP
jgi:sucrose phosphorylase